MRGRVRQEMKAGHIVPDAFQPDTYVERELSLLSRLSNWCNRSSLSICTALHFAFSISFCHIAHILLFYFYCKYVFDI